MTQAQKPALRTLEKTILSAALIAALAACGGGGGGDGAVTPPDGFNPDGSQFTPAPEVESSMIESITPPTYPADSEEMAAFNTLNAERLRCGFGTLKQNANLDIAAKGHVHWMLTNRIYSHDQSDPSTPGFTGANPGIRANNAGYFGRFVAENIAVDVADNKAGLGEISTRSLFAATYHSIGQLRQLQDVGIHLGASSDIGALGKVNILLITTGSLKDFQLLRKDAISTYPCEGTTNTMYEHPDEIPNPVPGRDLVMNRLGHPIIVMARANQVLKLTSVTMVNAANGHPVPMRKPVTGDEDPNGRLSTQPHFGYAIPDAPLLPGTTYKVNIEGLNNGAGFKKEFSFTTGMRSSFPAQ